jgi:hypothetical protein
VTWASHMQHLRTLRVGASRYSSGVAPMTAQGLDMSNSQAVALGYRNALEVYNSSQQIS